MATNENQDWDLQIKPHPRLFDIDIKEVWRYRDLLMLFVRRDFVAQYKQTILGPLWHLIQPILTTIMFLIVFGKIAGIPTDGIEPILFYMSGLTMWNYFSICLTNTSSTFLMNASIFGKVYFPRIIMPLSVIVSNLLRFGIQFFLLIIAMVYFYFKGSYIDVSFAVVFIPVLLIIMAGIGLGLGLIMSSLTTRYRDLTVLLGFSVQLLMYATPIAYPMKFLYQTSYGWIIRLNPLSSIVEAFRFCLFGQGVFTAFDLLYSVCFMMFSLLAGVALFSNVEKNFMDTV
jgi:lipopolysaccharide transport system permease protein